MRERHQLGLIVSLAVIATAAFLILAGVPATPTAAQVGYTSTPTLTLTPAGTLTPTPDTCAAPLGLVEDSIVYIKGGVYLRADATVNSAIMAYLEQPMVFRVRGGPVCAQGYNWWLVSSGTLRGWAAEGRADTGYFMTDSGILANEESIACGESAGFVVGETILLYKSLRVRTDPGLSSLVLTVATDGTEAIVLEGPVCADTYNWWKVRLQVLGVIYDGWIAQGTKQSAYDWLESESALSQEICGQPLALDIGEAAYVAATNNTRKRLRTAPSLDAPVLYDLIVNTPIIIVDGPVCKDGFNWWKVTVRSNIEATGWMAEGPRWIKTISD
jgi:hypothetical protein